MITGRIGRHEVVLPINHKNYNFWEEKNTKVWTKGKFALKEWQRSRKLFNVALKGSDIFQGNNILHIKETKVVIGWFKLQLWLWVVDLKFNWLTELSDNKLSDDNLTSELVENKSFF